MKKTLSIFLLFISFYSYSQQYSEVIQVPDKSVDELYSTSRAWFAKTFTSAKDVLQMDDPVAGKLIGKGTTLINEHYMAGITKVPISINFNIDFTITVEMREGRYKCNIDNIFIEPVIRGSQYPSSKQSFETIVANKEYYKNGSSADWLRKNGDATGNKISKMVARNTAPMNKAYYDMLTEIDVKLKAIMLSLKNSMKATDDNW